MLPRYSEANAIALMRKVCAGVKHLHEQNIIHRDLKPEVRQLQAVFLDEDT